MTRSSAVRRPVNAPEPRAEASGCPPAQRSSATRATACFRARLRDQIGALLRIVLAIIVSCGVLPGYYHFLHYPIGAIDGAGPIPEKIDLGALIDDTFYFYVSDTRPSLGPNDSYPALISQIRQALSVWNSVPYSGLRIGFGGIISGELKGETPAGEIMFAELPPGVVGLGGPLTLDQPSDGFVPIVKSQVILSNNLATNARPRSSFSELFFNTLVHELGHALGLQHSLASSAMSTDVTRSTTRARPLAADDVAGISALYPTELFEEFFGVIEGRVTDLANRPIPLASVAAVRPGGDVVTALTDRQGRYKIEGLLPGRYLLYVHPLPPTEQSGLGPARIVLPTDAQGTTLSAAPSFLTQFFGGVVRPEDSPFVEVESGSETENRDFRVRRRRQPALYDVSTYSFPGNRAPGVHPAFVNLTQEGDFVLASGAGTVSDLRQVRVEALGRPVDILPPTRYDRDPRFARIDFEASPFAGVGPLHLMFRTANDFYVLPAAARLTSQAAPVIHWMTPDFSQDSPAWRVTGDNFHPRSRVFFDGAQAQVADFDELSRELIVNPPPGPPGHRAVITVYNPDGQSSAFTLPDGNVVFRYADFAEPRIRLSPSRSAADRDLVITVLTDSLEIDPSQFSIGFGSSDIVTRDIEVVAPNRARAVVTIRRGAAPDVYPVTIANGLQTVVLPDRFEVDPVALTSDFAPVIRHGGLVNSATGTPDISPGTRATLVGDNLAVIPGDVRVTFNGQQARVIRASAGQVELVVPARVPPGVAELRVFNGEAASEPLLVRLRRVSPGLFRALRTNGQLLGSGAQIRPGEAIELLATGINSVAGVATDVAASLAGLQIEVGGLRLGPQSIREDANFPGGFRIRVQIPRVRLSAEEVEVALWATGRRSNVLKLGFASVSAAPAPTPPIIQPVPPIIQPNPIDVEPNGAVRTAAQAF